MSGVFAAEPGAATPIRVAMVGIGFIGRALARQWMTAVPGIELVAVASRRVEDARRVCGEEGRRAPMVFDEPLAVCELDEVDVVVDATGTVEMAARLALHAIRNGKHIVTNSEVGATLGPILEVYARRRGVVFTDTDGDQPGVILSLFREVTAMGLRPVLAGNIKGFLDRHSNPDTQRVWAERQGQHPRRITAFSDGTKLALEMAVVANATGFRAAVRGMHGPRCDHVRDAAGLFRVDELLDELLDGGRVDYVLGAEPAGGAFVVAYEDDPAKRSYLEYLKLGPGPLHVLHAPFHLPHLGTTLTVMRAVTRSQAAVAPLGAPVCDVIAVAKRSLRAGEVLDGIGGFTVYGLLENADLVRRDRLLPVGLAAGCRVVRDVAADAVLQWDDVEPPAERVCDRLRREQDGFPF